MKRRLDFRVRWHGDEVAERVEKAAEQGLRAAGEQVIKDGNRSTPFLTGALRESGRVDVVYPVAIVSYGMFGPARQYAAPQHQRRDYFHPRGGGPKFLENELKDGDKVFTTVADYISKAIDEGP